MTCDSGTGKADASRIANHFKALAEQGKEPFTQELKEDEARSLAAEAGPLSNQALDAREALVSAGILSPFQG